MFETTYPPYSHEIEAFGSAWCGPEMYEDHKENLVARCESPEGSDGQTVEVYCRPAPARFYTLKVFAGPNSCGDHQPGYELQTGSGMVELTARIAVAIAEGMLALNPESIQQP